MDTTAMPARPARKPGVFALLLKVGGKLSSVLVKLLKSLKFGKVLLAGASFGAYALMWSWQFALVLIAGLLFHEMGHVWAMRRYGMKTKGIYLIPFLGAAAVAEDRFPSRKAETVIALMGPIWGFALALATFAAYLATDVPLLAALAGWTAMINLFNLLPINPLDGGRVMKSVAYSVSSRLGAWFLWLGIASAFFLAYRFRLGLFWILLLVGVLELVQEGKKIRRIQDRRRILESLSGVLGVPAEPEAVIGRIARIDAHLAQGVTGTFPPALLDQDPYMGSFSPREWVTYFEARIVGHVSRSRIERRKLFGGGTYFATSSAALELNRPPAGDSSRPTEVDADSPLFLFLRDGSGGMAPMRPAEAAAGFLAYAVLAAALAALMFATAHIPAAQAALGVFMD